MSLFFGEKWDTSQCLSSWITHFKYNRVYYQSLQDADKSFLSQVLFAIDRALQIYWQSCGETNNKKKVNTRILQMQDLHNNIECHNFFYILPRVISDKFLPNPSENQDGQNNGKRPGKKRDKEDNDKEKKKTTRGRQPQTVACQIDREFFRTLLEKQKNGTIICMKFFVKGFCHKACPRADKLSNKEEKEFDTFIKKCRMLDFQQGAEETTAP
jgi:hypothetical protein